MRRWLLVSFTPSSTKIESCHSTCVWWICQSPTHLTLLSPGAQCISARPTYVTQCIGRPLFLWQRCGPFALTLHSLGLPRTRCGLTLTPSWHPHRSGIHSLQVSTVCKSQMRMGRSRMGRTAHKASGCTSRYARGGGCLYPHPFLRVLVRV
jgi:hypothetical protein